MTTDVDRWLDDLGETCMLRAGLTSGNTVVEFGCGKGNYSIPTARIIQQRGKLYALDRNPQAIAELQNRLQESALPQVKTVHTDGRLELPLPDGAADVVLLHDVVHIVGLEECNGEIVRRSTVKDRAPLLREAWRVLRAEGLLSVFSPHLLTHTDLGSEEDLDREISAVGFELNRDFHCQLVHNDQLEHNRLRVFRKTAPSNRAL